MLEILTSESCKFQWHIIGRQLLFCSCLFENYGSNDCVYILNPVAVNPFEMTTTVTTAKKTYRWMNYRQTVSNY